jgi:hypothetical protein
MRYRWPASLAYSLLCGLCVLCGESNQRRNPVDWGSDHVGKPVPEYITGDECLFCHRTDIGPRWTKNLHSHTIHEATADSRALAALKKSAAAKDLTAEVALLLGSRQSICFLKRSRDYGKLDVLTSRWQADNGKMGSLVATDHPAWDTKLFADRCAGCHTTGVDSRERTFGTLSLDCYVCHGEVNVEHAKKGATVHLHLDKKGSDPARVVTSICAQCHLRGAKSRSTDLPYPNNFVAGDNLFRDYEFDFSLERLKQLNPGDRHVVENVRDVVLLGKEEVTCLSCHDIHGMSTKKHHRLAEDSSCVLCHNPTGSKKVRPAYKVHSKTCGY